MTDIGSETDAEAAPVSDRSLVDIARDTFAATMQVAEASLALLRAELKLARHSALTIVWLGFALIFVGATAWLSIAAAIAVGVFQLSGNLFLGIATVAFINICAALWAIAGMRRCWRDLSLPQTRALWVSGSGTAKELQEKS